MYDIDNTTIASYKKIFKTEAYAKNSSVVNRGSRENVVFQIHVLTMNRALSLGRLLKTLENSNYYGDSVQIQIHVDMSNSNIQCVDVARNFNFSHGDVQVHASIKTKGLRNAWFAAWQPKPNERAIILEDDIEVSKDWYLWLKGAWKAYDQREDLAGISLQRQTLVPQNPSKTMEIVNGHAPFLYALVGSIGFSPHWKQWRDFLGWIAEVDVETIDIRTPGLVTSDWSEKLDKRHMWTQYFIWFCRQRDLYTLYVNLPLKKTLAAHMREKGEHFRRNEGRDFELAVDVVLDYPVSLVRYGWDGMVVQTASSNKNRVSRFSSSELLCIKEAAGVFRAPNRSNSDLSKTILVTASNYAYRHILKNWETLARKWGYRWLVVAMDTQIFEHVGPLRSVRINTASHLHVNTESHYRTSAFNSISVQKLVFVRDLMELGYDVIFCDPDNIFIKDVFRVDTELMQMIRSNRIDYLYSVETRPDVSAAVMTSKLDSCELMAEYEGNTGFYYVSSKHAHSRTLFTNAIKQSVVSPGLDDQTIFWNELRKMRNRQHCRKERHRDGTLSLVWNSTSSYGTKFTYCCMDPRKIVTGRDVRSDKNFIFPNPGLRFGFWI